MKAIEITQYVKSPAELKVTELPDPVPQDDEYLVEVRAAATNFFDILQIAGKYQNQPPFPWIAGAEFAGVVLSTPKSSKNPRFAKGARVFGASQGAYATKCTVKEVSMLPVPEGWSFAESAGLFITAPTSYAALVVRAQVKKGDYVLVHAAAGGVGLAAVQVAKAFGATVIATASTGRKLQVAKSFGADHVLDYKDPEWPTKVKKLTPKGHGVDIVYDPVGLVDKSTKCTAWNGRILVVGFAAGAIEKVPMNKVLLKNISLVGIHWGAYSVNQTETVSLVWEGITRLVKEGKLRSTEFTDEEFVGLHRVKDALVALSGRGTWGKVVVKVPREESSRFEPEPVIAQLRRHAYNVQMSPIAMMQGLRAEESSGRDQPRGRLERVIDDCAKAEDTLDHKPLRPAITHETAAGPSASNPPSPKAIATAIAMKRAQRGFASAPGGGSGFGSAASAGSLSYLAEPPSFAAISDPNVIVSLKSLLKKDGTTKAKALEDLIHVAQAHAFEDDGGVEEGLLDVWTQVYARISIDNSRRVRELSHTLQSELLRSARKRMERRVPKIVGPWLAGVYDRDRVVGRAASDGISSFLTTPEKLTAFWSKCQPQILDFAREAIRETQDTLSDERSTTSEDAEAKFHRVIASSLSLVMGLLQRVDDAGLQKAVAKYDDYFDQETVWKTITFKDSTVRRTVCQLLFTCLDRKLPYATSTRARQAFVTGGLKSSQAGSALEYVRALTKLTQHDASIWSSASDDKKSPLARLQSFISKGSQGSPNKFWEALDQLLALIPADTLGLDTASKLLTSIKAGISHREEPRTNTSYSWKCFIDTAKRSMDQLPHDAKLALAQEHLFPLLEQFLFSTSDTSSFPTGPNAMSILVQAHLAAIKSSSEVGQASAEEWDRLGTVLCSNISGSLPEVSKEYKSSQGRIAEQGRRWFGLVGQIFNALTESGAGLPDQTSGPSARIVCQCASLLESRNMKPFGAAQIVEYALSTSQHLFIGDLGDRLAVFLQTAAQDGIEQVATSAAAKSMLSCLGIFGSIQGRDGAYQETWRLWTKGCLQLTDEQTRDSMLASLLSQDHAATLSRDDKELQEFLSSQSLAILTSESEAWDLLETALMHDSVSDKVCHELGVELVSRLSKSTTQPDSALKMIEMLARSRPSIFSQGSLRTELVAQLLSSSEIEDASTSMKASAILSILNAESQGQLPVVEIVHASLERASAQSLGIPTLVSQAKSAMQSGVPSWEKILPNTNAWMSRMAPFLDSPIDPALSITSNIGGSISLPRVARHGGGALSSIPRDRDGRSVPLRMAMYTSDLLTQAVESPQLPRQFHIEVLFLQCLAIQLASDQISFMSQPGLWLTLDDEISLIEAGELIGASRSLLKRLIAKAEDWIAPDESADHPSTIISGLLELALKESRDMSPRGAYSARVLAELLQTLIQAHGLPREVEEKYLEADNLKAKPDTALLASGLISGLGDAAQSSKAVSNFCNRLVSEVAALSPKDEQAEMTLTLLALTGQVYETGDLPVANNRIVFAVRQITSWLDDTSHLDSSLCAAICRALKVLLPCMAEVYGSYWESTLQFCAELWTRAAHRGDLHDAIPFVHASLKLYKVLDSIAEPNDDLADALGEFSAPKSRGLLELLRADRPVSSQPLDIVDGMLCREVEQIPISRIPEPEALFELISSESRDIQTAAFGLLHRKIPVDQQQKSVDALLDKTDARLPDQLLSLLLDPPTLDNFSDEALSGFPASIRGYLLSWKLVFDAYGSSQFKIRDDYTQHLKSEGLVPPLLDFMFDILGHSAGRPLILDKERLGPDQICDYDVMLAESETGEQSLHWLLVHVFYLTLKFAPGLFRAWYIDCRSKQTKIAVGSWTTRYFSPIIVRETLDSVEAWVSEQPAPAADEKELLVKVSRTAREVTAGYAVDESQAAIVVKIPPGYPIDGVTVSSLNRVAVSERRWQSWIMTTQGAITLANGSIIDGLHVFRRNITAALQGQCECAICYSIISEDKRMPDKKCSTCSNLFHRTCLYKWFQSSNQNSCPLCRNPIDYLGADTARRRQ
ncbi:hypothetical protein E4U41_000773 [Claviceps citrina]|nr:hypothetical protein E4U41_000773 [Claviceps citrina]